MNITISKIFKEAKVRPTPAVLDRVGDGRKYRRGKTLVKNGKMAECIIIEDNNNIDVTIIEFLRNYIKSGKLERITVIKLEEHIRNLRRNSKKSEDDFQENISIDDYIVVENVEEASSNQRNNKEIDWNKEKHDKIDERNNVLGNPDYDKYFGLVAPNEDLWYSYSESNKKEIFKALYENKHILGMLLEKIAEKHR